MHNPAPVLPYDAEVKRKALHLGALVLPVGLLVLGRTAALFLLVPLAAVAVFCDVARQRWPWMHGFIGWVFGPIMRPEEQPAFGGPVVLNGATWMCVSAALCAALFSEPVAAAALAMLMVGDGAAAVVGRRYGRHRYRFGPASAKSPDSRRKPSGSRRKSLEGSAAFFVTAVLAALPLTSTLLPVPLTLRQLAFGAFAAALAEALPLPANDNVRVPLVAGLVMMAV